MKNLITKSLFAVALTTALFSCDKPTEPQPDPTQQIEAKQTDASSGDSQAKLDSKFQWKLAKSGIFGNGERVSLKTPIGMGYMFGGDLTFNKFTDDAAFMPLSASFLNLGKIDKNSIDAADLSTKRFNTNKIWAADGNGADKPYEFEAGTIIAVRNTEGKYFLIEVKKLLGYEVDVNIYETSYGSGHFRTSQYELPDGLR